MKAGIFVTPNGNLIYVRKDQTIACTTMSPNAWVGVKTHYYKGSDRVHFNPTGTFGGSIGPCTRVANVPNGCTKPKEYMDRIQAQRANWSASFDIDPAVVAIVKASFTGMECPPGMGQDELVTQHYDDPSPTNPYAEFVKKMSNTPHSDEPRQMGMPAALGAGYGVTVTGRRPSSPAEQLMVSRPVVLGAGDGGGATDEEFQARMRQHRERNPTIVFVESRDDADAYVRTTLQFKAEVQKQVADTFGLPNPSRPVERVSMRDLVVNDVVKVFPKPVSHPAITGRPLHPQMKKVGIKGLLVRPDSEDHQAIIALQRGEFRLCGNKSARKHRKQGHRVWFHPVFQCYAWAPQESKP